MADIDCKCERMTFTHTVDVEKWYRCDDCGAVWRTDADDASPKSPEVLRISLEIHGPHWLLPRVVADLQAGYLETYGRRVGVFWEWSEKAQLTMEVPAVDVAKELEMDVSDG